jgi:hypothetical protein
LRLDVLKRIQTPMAAQRRFTGWNLTPNGWRRVATSDNASDAIGERPPDALLALVSAMRDDEVPIVTILYRSEDRDAVQLALARFGNKPAD